MRKGRVLSWRIPGLRFLPDATFFRTRQIKATYALASRADVIDYKKGTQQTPQKRWILTVEDENPNARAPHCQQKKRKEVKEKEVWTTTIPWIWFRQSDRPRKECGSHSSPKSIPTGLSVKESCWAFDCGTRSSSRHREAIDLFFNYYCH